MLIFTHYLNTINNTILTNISNMIERNKIVIKQKFAQRSSKSLKA